MTVMIFGISQGNFLVQRLHRWLVSWLELVVEVASLCQALPLKGPVRGLPGDLSSAHYPSSLSQ